jgi:bifunctional non-homologous end joining protein LigD
VKVAAALYLAGMRWTSSTRVRVAPGFVEPCLPTLATNPPIGAEWVYEIKHDGYRLVVQKMDAGVRIYTKRGADWTRRFPRIVEAVGKLKCKTALIDGEAIIAGADGLAAFDLLHSRGHDERVTLCAFDLLELNGTDVAAFPLARRKEWLKRLLGRAGEDIAVNEHFAGDGAEIFAQACKLGCEGIVAKRIDLPYESGRSKRWLKNPESAAASPAEEGTF